VRIDGAAEPLGPSADPALRCGGFFVIWLDDRPSVRLVSGERRLAAGIPDAIVEALADAPRLLREALRVCAPRRPWDRVEVTVTPGARTGGEALSLGARNRRRTRIRRAPAPGAVGSAGSTAGLAP